MIIVNPTENQIDIDLAKAEEILLFHNAKSRIHFETLLDKFINTNKLKIVYIHHYTADNSYSVGIIEKRD